MMWKRLTERVHCTAAGLSTPTPDAPALEIIESIVEPRHWNPASHSPLSHPQKNMDRMEWLVEKAVEIGVDRMVFLDCEHSERRVVNRNGSKELWFPP